MDRHALVLALLLACGEPGTTAPDRSDSTGAETDPAVADPALEELVELAGAEATREEALARANELHAELAEADPSRKEAIADAMGRALVTIDGTAGIDNRLRVALIRALGGSGANAARGPLTTIVRRQRDDQSFLFNRLALEQLATRGEVADLDVLIEGLFLFGANPAMRTNDIAVVGLAQLGEAAVPPLLRVLAGEHPRARELAEEYVAAIEARVRSAHNVSVPTADQELATEALYGLGVVGRASALEPLLETSRSEDPLIRLGAAMALVSLRPALDDATPIREALVRVYERATEVVHRLQLLAAARRLGDPELAPFLREIAEDGDAEVSVRLVAATDWALLTTDDDQRTLERLGRGDRTIAAQLRELRSILAESERCSDLPCWVQAFREHARSADVELAEKAAIRIGQLGRRDARAISALTAQLDHRDLRVRLAALRALDWIAVDGSRAAVQRLNELREQEEGRAIWTQFAKEAIPVQGRLIARGH
jgi:hypothetical protein